ncbi:hypothetical protein [Jeotgalibacillus marinus]|uniref:Lipoprotein n=1 Tax=Jeotgalibacillus marinus TaxID=86667 RepID=A0ABV3Q080_9BACL
MKNKKTTVKQLILGYILFGIFIILGCLQIMLTPFTFVRGINLISVIAFSMGVGAFSKRAFYITKKMIDENHNLKIPTTK